MLLFLFSFLTVQNSLAQNAAEITELSLDEAVRLALENNLNLKKNQIDVDISGYSEKHIWAEIFPAISASARTGFASTPLFSGAGFELNDSRLRNSLGVGISLGLNAGIPYSMKSIKLAHQNNLLKYEDAQNQVSIQVTKIFYSLLAEKDNISLLEEVFKLAQSQHERNEISFRNGYIPELVLTQSSLALENARYNLSIASITHVNDKHEFFDIIGIVPDSKIDLLGDINIVKIEADTTVLIEKYLNNRPDIVRGRQEIERLEYVEKQLAMQSRAPSINLSMDWSSSKFDPFTDTFGASASLSIPLDSWIPGTSKAQGIRRAKGSTEKARLDLQIIKGAAEIQIRSFAELLNNSWKSVEIARSSYEAAQSNYQMTYEGFINGTIESLILEDARNNMADSRQRLFQSELAYFNMILDLSAVINVDWKNLINEFGVTSE